MLGEASEKLLCRSVSLHCMSGMVKGQHRAAKKVASLLECAESCGDNTQVVLAVDDSRSMQENGCGVFALEAVTLLTRALTRLEVGQVGVLRFGGTDHVRPLHDLNTPFSDAAGPNIISNLRFDQVGSLCHKKCGLQTQEYLHPVDTGICHQQNRCGLSLLSSD